MSRDSDSKYSDVRGLNLLGDDERCLTAITAVSANRSMIPSALKVVVMEKKGKSM